MSITEGDRVYVLSELQEGTVSKVRCGVVCICTDEGFEYEYPLSQIVKKGASMDFFPSVTLPKDDPKILKKVTKSRKKRKQVLEVDLHLCDVFRKKIPKGVDALRYQLDLARESLHHLISCRVGKLILIHGLGQGILREELEQLLQSYPKLTFYDADYALYGAGAMEVVRLRAEVI